MSVLFHKPWNKIVDAFHAFYSHLDHVVNGFFFTYFKIIICVDSILLLLLLQIVSLLHFWLFEILSIGAGIKIQLLWWNIF